GLYEATFTTKDGDTASAELVRGEWVMRCVPRTLDDIRKLGVNDAEDERRFETMARVSEINNTLYRTFARPLVRSMVTPATAEAMRRAHPLRVQYEVFANNNPLMAPLEAMAKAVGSHRDPVEAQNPLLTLQKTFSDQIVASLDAWAQMRDAWTEAMFLGIYGS